MKTSIVLKSIRWNKAKIVAEIKSKNRVAINALMRIYSFQEAEEKVKGITKYNNEKGFNTIDAPILTSFAKQYKARGYLTTEQIKIIKKRIVKYAGQIFDYIMETYGNTPMTSTQMKLFGDEPPKKTKQRLNED